MSPSPSTLLRLLAALGALSLAAAACSDDDAADPPTVEEDDGGGDTTGDEADEAAESDVPDPCTLVTVEELQTLFGSPFDAGELTDSLDTAGLRQCTWSNTDAPPVKVVSIAVATDASQRAVFDIGVEEIFEQTRDQAEQGGTLTEPDMGLGDASFRSGSGVYVLDGDTSYSISVTGTSDEAVAGLEALAAQVLGG